MDLPWPVCYAAPMPHIDVKRFCIQTLGCKVNQYETQALAEAWRAAGLAPADSPDQADLIVLCSCAVTARAEAESRKLARSLVRQAKPQARVVVTGCAAAVAPDAFAGLGAIPAPDKARLARCPLETAPVPDHRPRAFPDLALSGYDRARALLKVQDGCSHGCTYCIVPAARGPSVSRPLAEIVAEARRLLAAGHQELVLTGINLGHYGRDLRPPLTFWELVAALEAALAPDFAGSARLRLGSLDPAMLHDEGLAVLAQSRMVCPHVHISLQSADPGILAAMGRRPRDAATVSTFLDALRRIWPRFGLGLDILTGFPGESEDAFAATAACLAALPLTYAHVFPYSRRSGTRAAAMPGQIPREVKAARAKALRDAAREKTSRFLDALADAPALTVALESVGPAKGTCQYYVDCVFGSEPAGTVGRLVAARPVGRQDDRLLVEPALEAGE